MAAFSAEEEGLISSNSSNNSSNSKNQNLKD